MFQIKNHKNYNHPPYLIQYHFINFCSIESRFSIRSRNSYPVQFYDQKPVLLNSFL